MCVVWHDSDRPDFHVAALMTGRAACDYIRECIRAHCVAEITHPDARSNVGGFTEASAPPALVQSLAMHKSMLEHVRRTLLLSIAAVLASGGLPLADEEMQSAKAPALHGDRSANQIVSVDAGPVLDHHRLSVVLVATQYPDNGITRGGERRKGKDDDGSGEFSDASLVVRWSQLAHDNAFAVDSEIRDPFPNARGWTMMYLAMHDALNAIVPKFQQYAFFGTDASAHPIAAAAQAARDVMNHIYPTRQAENDAELAFWLGQVPDGSRKTNGISLGMASAAAIINARANDNMLVSGEYALQDPLEPGDYRFVPPLEFVHRPAFGNSMPFGIGSGADFLPDPPPALTTSAYARSVNETQKFGRLNSTFRSQDQTNFGAWWLEFNEIQWGRIMRQLTETRRLRLHGAVRMFALANMANVDASVAVWYAKNYYDFWRPFHAIRLADTDGNRFTEADPSWVSEHIVPPLQEYPSAHAIQCQAIARTLRSILGTDRVSFATQSTTALPSNPVRSFNRLSVASMECRESRIMAGFHYRFSVNVGASMGNRVAKKIVDTQLLRR